MALSVLRIERVIVLFRFVEGQIVLVLTGLIVRDLRWVVMIKPVRLIVVMAVVR